MSEAVSPYYILAALAVLLVVVITLAVCGRVNDPKRKGIDES